VNHRAPRSGDATPEVVRHPRFRLRFKDRLIPFTRKDFVIGRSSECDLRLNDGLVSRRHARFVLIDDSLVVDDLGSRNGVFVNERKIEGPTALGHADVVTVGLGAVEVVDDHVLDRPEHLTTLPPPPARAIRTAPQGEADVDAPEQLTVRAQLNVLTARELEVLELLVHGHTQREMAERLHLSVKTIESHRAKIMEKLYCRTRAELVSYAIAAGLLRPASATK